MPTPLPPRDPKKVRFWGWMAFAAALVIVGVGLLVGRPWERCHCPLHPSTANSLNAPLVAVPVARVVR